MTKPSTRNSLQFFDLKLFGDCYYIKRSHIVQKIDFNHRTFYAKFERIDKPLTKLLLDQHIARDFTLATPLVNDGKVNYLLLEYRGDEPKRFYHLIVHLFESEGIASYGIYEGKNEARLQVFIYADEKSLEEATNILNSLTKKIKKHIGSSFKALPDNNLPPSYNIATLPYKQLISAPTSKVTMV